MSSQTTSPFLQDKRLPLASIATFPRLPFSERYTVTVNAISSIEASPAFWTNTSNSTSSPALMELRTSPVIASVVVSLGESIATTSASGPTRPSASLFSFSSSSVKSNATSEVLAIIKNAKIMGVNLFMSCPPTGRLASTRLCRVFMTWQKEMLTVGFN